MDDPLPINQMAGIFIIYAINDRGRTAPIDKAMEEQGCLYFGTGRRGISIPVPLVRLIVERLSRGLSHIAMPQVRFS